MKYSHRIEEKAVIRGKKENKKKHNLLIYRYLYTKHIFYYGNTPRTICLKVAIMALYMYYTPALILPKKGLNVTPTVTPTPKSGFLSVEVAGYLLGVFSTPF